MMSLILAAVFLVAMPNPTLTPGTLAVDAQGNPLTTEYICAKQWGKDHRFVTQAMKRQVAANYQLDFKTIAGRGKSLCCEYDHLIPRELGGADAIANYWPQPWADATTKDKEENRLHREVCKGFLTLAEAQQQMVAWGRNATSVRPASLIRKDDEGRISIDGGLWFAGGRR